jgi:spore germination cell wall hydrolase CwlJ-like protein
MVAAADYGVSLPALYGRATMTDLIDPSAVKFRASLVPGFVAPVREHGAKAGAQGRSRACLATAVYFEARSESEEGQRAVAAVILNRVKAANYPSTVCGVVYQGAKRRNRCQFSFACDGKAENVADRSAWRRAVDVARSVLLSGGKVRIAAVGNATHYHATSVHPVWAGQMRRVDIIGSHVFYVGRSARS